MSTAEAAHRPDHKGRALSLWIGFLLVIAAGVALAWFGAHSVRQRTVQVETLHAGSGPNVQAQDGVLIDYEGRLENGKVFDSSAGKGPVPVLPTQVIPGFGEALLRMQEGGHYKVHIPSKLAYGANPPAGAPIPPNAVLDFDVKVVKVVPNGTLMAQEQQQMQQQQMQQQQMQQEQMQQMQQQQMPGQQPEQQLPQQQQEQQQLPPQQ